MDVLGWAAVGLVGLEWLGIGWLAGMRWPGGGDPSATWGLRLLVGAVLTTFAMLVLASVGVGFSRPILVLAMAALAAIGLRVVQRSTGCNDQRTKCKKERLSSTRERIGWIALGILLVAAVARAFSVPESGWDAYSHWGLKALAYSQTGTIVGTYTVHEYYPPLVPLAEALVYIQRGSASIDLGKDVWALIASAFVLCLAGQLRRLLFRRWLAPFVAAGVLLVSTQLLEDFSTGQADLALTAFLTLATLAALQWLRDGQRGWLAQVALFAAAAALAKFEGLPRVGVIAAAAAVEAALLRRAGAWWPVVWLVVGGLAGAAVWLGFELAHGITPTGEHVGALQPQALGATALALIAVFGGLRTGGAILAVVLAWLVAAKRSLAQPTRLLALVVLGQALATVVAFLVSDTAPDVEVRTAATRLVEQFMPVALVLSAVWLEAELIIRPAR